MQSESKIKENFEHLLNQKGEFDTLILKKYVFKQDELELLGNILIDEIFTSCFDLKKIRDIHRQLYFTPIVQKNEFGNEITTQSFDVANPFDSSRSIYLNRFSVYILYLFLLKIENILIMRTGDKLTKRQNSDLYEHIDKIDWQKTKNMFAYYDDDLSEPINELYIYLQRIFEAEQKTSDFPLLAVNNEADTNTQSAHSELIEATQSPNNGIVKDFIYFTKKENGKYTDNPDKYIYYVEFASAIFRYMVDVKGYQAKNVSATWFELVFDDRIFEFNKDFMGKVKNQLKSTHRKETEPRSPKLYNEICAILHN